MSAEPIRVPALPSLALRVAPVVAAGWWAAAGPAAAADTYVPEDYFAVPDGLEVTVWARSPMFNNPTNIDIDAEGRIWVAEGVNYRGHSGRRAEGDRIMVLEDTDQDGTADASHVFVQEKFLEAPLGVAVFGNVVVVSMTPQMIVYTDVDRDLRFDPSVDRREVLLEGFMNRQHDHTLHSVTAGPDGQWYWNCGNCGAKFTDRSGKTFRISGAYERQPFAGEPSDDGHVYVGGFTARMNPDGTDVRIIGHNYRNSYEQAITSFGDVFQNDNDDPPACRVSFVLEFGNAGFSSFDGQRTWQADQRPGQPVAVAEWRQEDPGTMPAGDVYGGGSPTGVAFYENGALGESWEGLLLTCEAGRNVVFGYQPEPEGAGYRLERMDFITSNPGGEFAGSDFLGGGDSVRRDDVKTLFRPSDVAVGPDGAIYVSDWFDARVGGHQDLDDTLSGTIYRIAPKGFKPVVPKLDLGSIDGLIAALQSPAVNVRYLGQTGLQARGEAAVPALAKLLENRNRFVRARAVWMLSRLGAAGRSKVEALLDDDDPMMRVVAFRALRRLKEGDPAAVATLASAHAADPSAAVRREAALAVRDLPFVMARPILVEVARHFDGTDRTCLEAFGTGASKKEAAVWEAVAEAIGDSDPLKWSDAFAWITWRLTPEAAVPHLKARAADAGLGSERRKLAIDTLAFIKATPAADAMLELAANREDPLRDKIVWWLFNRNNNDWAEFGVLDGMKRLGIYDPENEELVSLVVPDPATTPVSYPPVADILGLDADPGRGRLAAARCLMCHAIDGVGVEYGPTLDDFGLTQTPEVIANAILEPSSDISHGYDGYEIVTNDGIAIHGLVIADGDPVIVKSTGGRTQTIARNRIKSQRKLGRSLMLTAGQQGMSAQDVADVVAFLREVSIRRNRPATAGTPPAEAN